MVLQGEQVMLKFYHAPWSRGSGVLWLLEELGADYELNHIDIRADGGVSEDYRLIQPNKKVPAIMHDGTVATERAAITIYLADAFPEANLAPPIGDPMRASYLSATVYCDAVFDPCISAHAHGLKYRSNDYSFGLLEDMVAYVERRLTENEFAAGDRFTAADTQLASAINYTMVMMKALPERTVFHDYLKRIEDRPAYKRAQAKDYALAQQVPAWKGRFG